MSMNWDHGTLDDDWFTGQVKRQQGMSREELLSEAKRLAFNYQQACRRAEAYRIGSDQMIMDLRRPLARVWKLLSWDKKSVRMDDLRYAIDLEYAEEQDARAAQRAYDAQHPENASVLSA